MNAKLLSKWCEEIGVSIGEREKGQILTYLRELVEWNRKVNLVAKASDEQILRKHFVDSLSLAPFIPEEADFPPFNPPTPFTKGGKREIKGGRGIRGRNAGDMLKLLDIGTGAGFPGLVLKITRQDILLHLLETSRKKCLFLKHIVSLLKLDGAEVLNGRVEDFGHMDGYRESYDIVVCRAVAHLSTIFEYAFPLLRLGGLFVAQKGPAGMDEFEEAKDALKILGGKVEEIKEFVLPGGRERRIILAFRKERATPSEYPRRDGVPAKNPLHRVTKSRPIKCLFCDSDSSDRLRNCPSSGRSAHVKGFPVGYSLRKITTTVRGNAGG